MRTFFFLLLIVCITPSVWAQKDMTEAEMKQMKTEIEASARQFSKSLDVDGNSKFDIDFSLDTFRIEETIRRRIDFDMSNNGMIQTMYDAEKEYDKLLNKYYKMFFNALDAADKEVLKQTQKNWLAFRDSERKLSGNITVKENYTGGGSINRLFLASHYCDLTKRRVVEIYEHLSMFMEFQK